MKQFTGNYAMTSTVCSNIFVKHRALGEDIRFADVKRIQSADGRASYWVTRHGTAAGFEFKVTFQLQYAATNDGVRAITSCNWSIGRNVKTLRRLLAKNSVLRNKSPWMRSASGAILIKSQIFIERINIHNQSSSSHQSSSLHEIC